MRSQSRRQFLETSMWTSASLFAASRMQSSAFAQQDDTKASPNEKLTVGVIGVNGRGQSHVHQFVKCSRTQVAAICDVDESVGQKMCEAVAESQNGLKPTYYRDLRKMLDDKTIDVVSVATPNHWHALASLWAVQAGKDVYVEKPVSHNVSEGRRLVEAARKYNRMVQTGTQSRSNPGMRQAIEYIHGGGIGQIKLARGLCYKRRPSIGEKGKYEVPASVDYDLWSGPAPILPLTRPRFHYDWHWQWAYGNGDLGNQGIHQMDLCRWALNKSTLSERILSYGGRFGYEDAGETANTQVVVHSYGEQQLVFEVRGLETKDYQGATVGIIVEGSDGYLVMTSYSAGIAFDRDGKEIKRFENGSDDFHYENFVDAVIARDHTKLNADIEEGHLSSALCHTANISLRLGQMTPAPEINNLIKDVQGPDDAADTLARTLEHLEENKIDVSSLKVQFGKALVMDTKSETFVNDADADAMLTREYRAPYVIPKAGEV